MHREVLDPSAKRKRAKKRGEPFFSTRRLAELRQDYDARCADGAVLRVDELEEVLREYGHAPTKDELYELLPGIDDDGRRAVVSFEDFVLAHEFEAKRLVDLGVGAGAGTSVAEAAATASALARTAVLDDMGRPRASSAGGSRPRTPDSPAGSVGSRSSTPSRDHLDILGAFASLEDPEAPGFVSAEDIQAVMRDAGLAGMEVEDVHRMAASVGAEPKGGKIDYAAFVKLMLG